MDLSLLSSCSLKDAEPLEFPVRIGKCRRIGGNEVGAVSRASALLSVILLLSRPLPTKIDIGNDGLVLEVRADGAVGRGEVGHRRAP